MHRATVLLCVVVVTLRWRCPRVREPCCGASRAHTGLRSRTFSALDASMLARRLEVLRGSRTTVKRDQPVITTEVMVHARGQKRARLDELLEDLRALGYDVFIVDEICGVRADYRNLLSLPRSRAAQLAGSNVLDLAVAARALLAVDASTIRHYAFPCCAPGGECCPDAVAVRNSCCAHWRVHEWMQRELREGKLDIGLSYLTRTTWYDQGERRLRPHAQLLRLQETDLQRSDLVNATGQLRKGSAFGAGGFSYYRAYAAEQARLNRMLSR